MACILGVIACGKTDKAGTPDESKQSGPPDSKVTPQVAQLPDCILTQTPTKAQAWAAYRQTGGQEAETDAVELVPEERMSSAYALVAGDRPLGTVYWCGFYVRKADAASAMLLEWGWKDGDAETRRKQASRVDEDFLAAVVRTQPPAWDPAHAWQEAQTTTEPDGGVRRVRWLRRFEPNGIPAYDLVELTIGADGRIAEPRKLDGFVIAPASPPVAGPGAPLVGCDPAGIPTREQAMLAYQSTGGRKDERGTIVEGTGLDGVSVLVHYSGGADAPVYELGVVWRCRLHPGRAAAARAILLDLGWDQADPAGRIALVARVDDGLLASVLHKQPSSWDTAHPFAAPDTVALPDGGVRRTRWSASEGHVWGGSYPVLSHDSITVAADGTVGPLEHLDGFELPAR